MAYRVFDVTRMPYHMPEVGKADTIEQAAEVAASHLKTVFGARPYKVIAERDHEQDGLDILAYAGLESCQIAVNKVA